MKPIIPIATLKSEVGIIYIQISPQYRFTSAVTGFPDFRLSCVITHYLVLVCSAFTTLRFNVYFLATSTQSNPAAENGVNTIQMVSILLISLVP